MEKTAKDIFRKGSKTFYTASLFFPPSLRREVTVLYAFVRTADDYVDCVPQDADGFLSFRRDYQTAMQTGRSGNAVVDSFVALSRARGFQEEWAAAFLDAMGQDLEKSVYGTLDELLGYVHGSAEVVGLMMARLMGVPEQGFEAARLLGRAFQFINFVRDIKEDLELGRVYLPAEELRRCGLEGLSESEARRKPEAFAQFVSLQCDRYRQWRDEARRHFSVIPGRARAAVSTAADMYDFTARAIQKEPLLVFRKKVKPSRPAILARAMGNVAGVLLAGR